MEPEEREEIYHFLIGVYSKSELEQCDDEELIDLLDYYMTKEAIKKKCEGYDFKNEQYKN